MVTEEQLVLQGALVVLELIYLLMVDQEVVLLELVMEELEEVIGALDMEVQDINLEEELELGEVMVVLMAVEVELVAHIKMGEKEVCMEEVEVDLMEQMEEMVVLMAVEADHIMENTV